MKGSEGRMTGAPRPADAMAMAALALALTVACRPAPRYDLVIANGRVMDPESGLDAVRHVGIRGGTIAAISETPLAGRPRDRRLPPRRGARLRRPARARAAGRVVSDDGARRRHLRVRARGGHGRRGRLVCGARRRPDRELRRVGRAHPGADEGAGRSRPGPAARRHRRQRHGRPTRRWRRWKRSCARGSRRAPSRWASAARTRPARPWPRSSACSGRGRRAAPRPTSTCAAGSPGCARPSRRRRPPRAPLHIVHVNSSAGDELDGFLAAIKAARDAGQDVTTEAYPVRRGDDGDPVGAVRRLGDVARRALRPAPAGGHGRAPDPRRRSRKRARPAAR